MSGACRLGDPAKVLLDHHGCPACPHPNARGPAITGSFDVKINGAPAVREGDVGIHATCCNTNTWKVHKGSGKVIVNGRPLARKGDPTEHCGGRGKMDDASGNVVDGSGDAEREELKEQIAEWLERVRENGIAELLHMVSPGLGAAYFAIGEFAKLFSPECHGSEYFKHLAKCLPSKPPGWDDRDPPRPHGPHPVPVSSPRYHGPPDPGAEPVGLLDPTNPITDIVMIPVGAVRGVGAGVEAAPGLVRGAVEAAPKAGKWVVNGLGDVGGSLVGALP